jgi:hypothetical protein
MRVMTFGPSMKGKSSLFFVGFAEIYEMVLFRNVGEEIFGYGRFVQYHDNVFVMDIRPTLR